MSILLGHFVCSGYGPFSSASHLPRTRCDSSKMLCATDENMEEYEVLEFKICHATHLGFASRSKTHDHCILPWATTGHLHQQFRRGQHFSTPASPLNYPGFTWVHSWKRYHSVFTGLLKNLHLPEPERGRSTHPSNTPVVGVRGCGTHT